MFTTNPFSTLSEMMITPEIMQGYVIIMVLLVIAVLLPRDDAPLDGQPPTDAQNAENGAAATERRRL